MKGVTIKLLEKFQSYKDIEAYVNQYCEKEEPNMKESTKNLISDFLILLKESYRSFDLHLKIKSEKDENDNPRYIHYTCDITSQLDSLLVNKYAENHSYILQLESCLYVIKTEEFSIGSLITDYNQRILFIHLNNNIEGKFKKDPSSLLYLLNGKRIVIDDDRDSPIRTETESGE